MGKAKEEQYLLTVFGPLGFFSDTSVMLESGEPVHQFTNLPKSLGTKSLASAILRPVGSRLSKLLDA